MTRSRAAVAALFCLSLAACATPSTPDDRDPEDATTTAAAPPTDVPPATTVEAVPPAPVGVVVRLSDRLSLGASFEHRLNKRHTFFAVLFL